MPGSGSAYRDQYDSERDRGGSGEGGEGGNRLRPRQVDRRSSFARELYAAGAEGGSRGRSAAGGSFGDPSVSGGGRRGDRESGNDGINAALLASMTRASQRWEGGGSGGNPYGSYGRDGSGGGDRIGRSSRSPGGRGEGEIANDMPSFSEAVARGVDEDQLREQFRITAAREAAGRVQKNAPAGYLRHPGSEGGGDSSLSRSLGSQRGGVTNNDSWGGSDRDAVGGGSSGTAGLAGASNGRRPPGPQPREGRPLPGPKPREPNLPPPRMNRPMLDPHLGIGPGGKRVPDLCPGELVGKRGGGGVKRIAQDELERAGEDR